MAMPVSSSRQTLNKPKPAQQSASASSRPIAETRDAKRLISAGEVLHPDMMTLDGQT
jgi:hypothetical protein